MHAGNNSKDGLCLNWPNWVRLVRLQVRGRAESSPITVPVRSTSLWLGRDGGPP
jgi:hypothetical protein